MGHADLQVALSQIDVVALFRNAGPFLAGFVEEIVDAVKSNFRVDGLAELNHFILAIFQRLFLIPNLGEDQLEDFVELILAAVSPTSPPF